MAKTTGVPPTTGDPRLVGTWCGCPPTRQGESGLGLEAQTDPPSRRYRASVNGVLLRTYTEIESGTHNDIDSRPKLKAAVADANLAPGQAGDREVRPIGQIHRDHGLPKIIV